MIDIFLERRFDAALTTADFFALVMQAAGCLNLHRVEWQHSMLGAGGHRCICWFRGIDLESVRLALRTADIETRTLWSGSVHDAPDREQDQIARANVVVERQFAEPVSLEHIQAIEDKGAHCLKMRNVEFMRTFFSLDRRRMLCLYEAPDAESVRDAQREAGMPVETVWTFQQLDGNALKAAH
jgi:hypothetical protein